MPVLHRKGTAESRNRRGDSNTPRENGGLRHGGSKRNWPPRRLPVGAEVIPGGGVHFRVWAPQRHSVEVVLEPPEHEPQSERKGFGLQPEDNGYFSGLVTQATSGDLYRFRLDEDSLLCPDPASRFQPSGPHGPSQIIDPMTFEWTDHHALR